ncbi:MAG: hypothetical protein HOP13_00355 [Alphaproteobacteria bacterium]|nr:hypothetical protein [Alphaproteobacteria bacterium]
MTQLTRRTFFEAFAGAAALHAIMASGALASPPADLNRWAQDVADLNRALAAGKIPLLGWQEQITALNTGVSLDALRRYLDFDRLTAAMTFPTNLAETKDPKFPQAVNIAGIERPWFLRFFGMRKGGAIIPHVHNNMVSSHLVMQGAFRTRTFDRVADLPAENAVLLKPTLDQTLSAGGMITMSDDRTNGHWLIAEADRSFTFDVGLVNLSKTRTYAMQANKYNMIFVDPTGKADGRGLVAAPVISFEGAVAKFAAQ